MSRIITRPGYGVKPHRSVGNGACPVIEILPDGSAVFWDDKVGPHAAWHFAPDDWKSFLKVISGGALLRDDGNICDLSGHDLDGLRHNIQLEFETSPDGRLWVLSRSDSPVTHVFNADEIGALYWAAISGQFTPGANWALESDHPCDTIMRVVDNGMEDREVQIMTVAA